jgi:hypothetical protein
VRIRAMAEAVYLAFRIGDRLVQVGRHSSRCVIGTYRGGARSAAAVDASVVFAAKSFCHCRPLAVLGRGLQATERSAPTPGLPE